MHQQILAELEGRVLNGTWPPGFRIPVEIDLAEEFGCSRMTMHKALSRLAEKGLIERRRKAGSFVRTAGSQSAILTIRDIREEVEASGCRYRYELVSRARQRANSDTRRRLGLAANTSLLALECRHFADDRPFCREERLIHLAAVPDAADESFKLIAPGAWLLERVPWSSAQHVIRAVAADAPSAAALDIKQGTPCLMMERQTHANDHLITSVRLTYPGDLHELAARFSPVA